MLLTKYNLHETFSLLYFSAVTVVGSDVTVVHGEQGVLTCNVIDTTERVTQVTWERQTKGHPQKSDFVAITSQGGLNVINGDGDRVKFVGNIDDKTGSLELSNITLMDEGIYTCAFILFPSGLHRKKMALFVVGMYICASEASFICAPENI